eukprot:m51a1_g592 hypothetical protein (1446) ;mRNA; r:42138-50231
MSANTEYVGLAIPLADPEFLQKNPDITLLGRFMSWLTNAARWKWVRGGMNQKDIIEMAMAHKCTKGAAEVAKLARAELTAIQAAQTEGDRPVDDRFRIIDEEEDVIMSLNQINAQYKFGEVTDISFGDIFSHVFERVIGVQAVAQQYMAAKKHGHSTMFEQEIPVIRYGSGSNASLAPLFGTAAELAAFRERHAAASARRADPRACDGVFVGVDSGSTTTKVVAVDAAGCVAFSDYGPNGGDPLGSARRALCRMHEAFGGCAPVLRACVTGYGEPLLRAGLQAEDGEVETVAHARAAAHFSGGQCSAVVDIGGQDMKVVRLNRGAVESVQLNEACSSGCGSFVETFAACLGMSARDFAAAGLASRAPADLGTRCTVFMTSRVRQAQRDGATIEDISAGIALSVVRNALYKVMRMRSPDELGSGRVVVTGGTFLNDSVLRAFEMLAGREVIRPDVAGLMGALGAALIARDRHSSSSTSAAAGCTPGPSAAVSTLLSAEELRSLAVETVATRCGRCSNNCGLTVSRFSTGGSYVTGNRCERGAVLAGDADARAQSSAAARRLPNVFAWKSARVFAPPAAGDRQTRGTVGIPRALSLYEDYPFWSAFFASLGYRVEASRVPRASDAGAGGALSVPGARESIPSDTACLPAKVMHGHVADLVARHVDVVFIPCSHKAAAHSLRGGLGGRHHCPLVGTYAEVVRANCDLGESKLFAPFLPLDDPQRLEERLLEEVRAQLFDATREQVHAALASARASQERYASELRRRGEDALAQMRSRGARGVVILGRPYHADPEVNHGIPEIVGSYGVAVLSEDSVAHLLGRGHEARLSVVDSWAYQSRMYAAAAFAASQPDLDVLQLVSFGCGIDAITQDQVRDILESAGRLHTVIKVDEISNPGAARVRVRSMLAAVNNRDSHWCPAPPAAAPERPLPNTTFPADAREKGWTLLVPQFSPWHMELIAEAVRHEGFNTVVLHETPRQCIEEGVRLVHSDLCYPAVCVIGQFVNELKSGRFDLARTALFLTQTGGSCRATNYIPLLNRAMRDSGTTVPVISVNVCGLGPQPGFRLHVGLVVRLLMALVYGDVLMQCTLRTRPYELVAGSVDRLRADMEARARAHLLGAASRREFNEVVADIVRAFDAVELRDVPRRPVVAVSGELLVKFAPEANNHVVDVVEAEGCEAHVTTLADFFACSALNISARRRLLSEPAKLGIAARCVRVLVEELQAPAREAMARSRRFDPPARVSELAREYGRVVSLGNQAGEGWILVAKMLDLARKHGVRSAVLVQPFGCLPSHVTARGMMRLLRREEPGLNVAAVDYDPGISEANQANRLRLLLAVARDPQLCRHRRDDVEDLADSTPCAAGSAACDGCAAAEPGRAAQCSTCSSSPSRAARARSPRGSGSVEFDAAEHWLVRLLLGLLVCLVADALLWWENRKARRAGHRPCPRASGI